MSCLWPEQVREAKGEPFGVPVLPLVYMITAISVFFGRLF